MNIVSYVKNNGIKHMWDVFYRYKLDRFIQKNLGIFLKKRSVKDIILIESHNDFDCNGGAFYDYLIKNNYNDRYKIVLFLKNKIPRKLPKNVFAVSLNKPGIKKNYYMWLAKYILVDCNFIKKMRNEQVLIYCTHGPIGLKNAKGLMKMPANLDYFLAPSEAFEAIIAETYTVDKPEEQFVYLGYPKHDVFYTADKGDLSKVTTDKYKKVILWMPTFRKGGGFRRNDSTAEQPLGIPLIETWDMYNRLNDFLNKKECLLIIKIHPMQDLSILKIEDSTNIRVLTGQRVKELNIDNSRLMKDVDALISDYSSAANDFLHCDKPIAYVMTDEKEYKLGFIVENIDEVLAGRKIYTYEEFERFIDDIIDDKDLYREKRHKFFDTIFKYHDGESSKRLAEFLKL